MDFAELPFVQTLSLQRGGGEGGSKPRGSQILAAK